MQTVIFRLIGFFKRFFSIQTPLIIHLVGLMDDLSCRTSRFNLNDPTQIQKELGEKLHIAQNSVSYRYRRAKLEEVGLVLDRFSNLLKAQLS